jgi:hypothetical protein
MNHDASPPQEAPDEFESSARSDQHCPVCTAVLIQEKCKVVCRSPRCTYRIIFNCSEF